jgi:N-hydroxyarylamine O-acetyltransferase
VNIDGYLRRIEYAGDLHPSAATLAGLHLAHATHIPFENLDILLGKPIRLDLESLERKLVDGRRGGYCFEQNLLFGAVLEHLGFSVTRLIARVRHRTTALLPRTHMALLVELADGRWIADVGFGADGLLLPVPFGEGAESRQFLWSYRVVPDGPRWVMQSFRESEWCDLYAFTLDPQEPVDYETANWYTSTHPNSRFVQTLTAQRVAADARFILRNRELITDRGDAVSSRTLQDQAEIMAVLADLFGLDFPPGTTFRFNDQCVAGDALQNFQVSRA